MSEGLAAVVVDDVTYHVNRHGIVFAPSKPDFLPGWSTVEFAEPEVCKAIHARIQPALLRWTSDGPIYDLGHMRRVLNESSAQ